MSLPYPFSLSEKGTKFASFLFFSVLILSTAFFVFADETVSTKNIFLDTDQDGLGNDEEKLYGTDPMVKDSDGDGYGDGVEVESGYDPLRPAPGDKIIKNAPETSSAAVGGDAENLTHQVADEIVNILKNNEGGEQEITVEDMDASVQKILGSDTEEVVLPEVALEDIRIKKLPKNLSEKKRAENEKEAAIEYLTVIAYLMANNAPHTLQTEDDLSEMLLSLSGESTSALLSGNMEYMNQLSARGEKMLEELKDVEVPENMLDVHVKALKMAKYAIQLKNEFKPTQDDPLGQIAVLSKAQGFIGGALGFMDEVHQKLVDYGIENIPLNL